MLLSRLINYVKGHLRHLQVFSCTSKELSLSTASLLVTKRSGKTKTKTLEIQNIWKDKNKYSGDPKKSVKTREKTKTTTNTKTKYSPAQARSSPSPLQLFWWQKDLERQKILERQKQKLLKGKNKHKDDIFLCGKQTIKTFFCLWQCFKL